MGTTNTKFRSFFGRNVRLYHAYVLHKETLPDHVLKAVRLFTSGCSLMCIVDAIRHDCLRCGLTPGRCFVGAGRDKEAARKRRMDKIRNKASANFNMNPVKEGA
jgi:hypothetical protein